MGYKEEPLQGMGGQMIQKLYAYLYEGEKLVGIQDCTLMPYEEVGDFLYMQDSMGRQVEWQREWVYND